MGNSDERQVPEVSIEEACPISPNAVSGPLTSEDAPIRELMSSVQESVFEGLGRPSVTEG